LAIAQPPVAPWDASTLVRAIPPILVLVCSGYAVLGMFTTLGAHNLAK
jgi:hypothetical protein